LRHLSRRVVRVEIGQKPGVVRGTGSSNPSPSSGESRANLPHTASGLRHSLDFTLRLVGPLASLPNDAELLELVGDARGLIA
jgi:hypothetical protein